MKKVQISILISSTVRNLFILLFIFPFLLCSKELFSQTGWYVDKNALGSGNGVNWQNAWVSFSSINWSSVQPGDTIYISGGTDSLIYNETLTIGKSGTSTNRIVITNGFSNGHDGKVIIDGQGNLSYNYQNNSHQYVNIENLNLRNAATYNVRLRNSNCVVKNCTIYISSGATAGIDVRGFNCLIDGNFATTSSGIGDGQRDFVQSTLGGNNVYRNNRVIINNTDIVDHCDVFQFYDMFSGCEIYNNFMWQNNTKTTNAQGIYISTSPGSWKVYNNIAYFPFAKHAISVSSVAPVPTKFEVYNNTLHQGAGSVEASLWFNGAIDTLIIKNNIFVSQGSVMPVDIDPTQSTAGLSLDYNLYYTPNSPNVIRYGGSNRTLDYMQSQGYENNGKDDIPGFFGSPISPNGFALTPGSPAIDGGTYIGSQYNFDILGIQRPQGISNDIGAFEFYDGGINDLTPPQLVGAELLDSVSLILEFSELMNESSVENSDNYAINNGVNVLNSVMLSGTQVRLTTSVHSSGIYQVSVNNVTDIAGNTISPQSNSMIYEYFNSSANLVNLPVVQANADNWYLNYTPDRTIDGITGGESRWGGSVPMPDTIVYNLNDIQILNQTKLSFYAWESGRIYNYSIQVSIDSINWTEIKTNIPSHSSEWSIEGIDPIEAKFIRIILLSNNQSVWAGLWEAEFWGHLKVPTNNDDEVTKPVTFSLEQNYPNPFNPTTTIKFSLPTDSNIKLVVYNMLGEEISTLANGFYETGTYEFNFNAVGLASGVYVYRLESKDLVENKKMIYLR